MLTFFKILLMIWPFVRDMFFGKKKLPDIIKDNKFRVLVLVVITISVTLNYFLGSRTVAISRDYLHLQGEYEALKSSRKTPVVQNQEVKQKVEHPVVLRAKPDPMPEVALPRLEKLPSHKTKATPPKHRDDSAARYQKLQKNLEAIKAQEQQEE